MTPDAELLHRIVTEMTVRSMNITVSMKRTLKIGDDFQSYEATESWSLKHDFFEAVRPEAARLISAHYTPQVLGDVLRSLAASGGLSAKEAKERADRAHKLYGGLYEALLEGYGQDGPTGDLSGAGHAGGPAGPLDSVGADVPPG